jgi:hypothetical protein
MSATEFDCPINRPVGQRVRRLKSCQTLWRLAALRQPDWKKRGQYFDPRSLLLSHPSLDEHAAESNFWLP